MKVSSKTQKIVVKEITLETLEERAIMLAMIRLAFETKNFQERAENMLFRAFNQNVFSEIDDIDEILNKIQIQMY
jgi:hypothetical protein